MANVDLSIAAAFELQTTPDVFEPSLEAVAGSVALADGLLLGDAGSGIGRSGITLQTQPRQRPKPPIPGSRTKPDDFFVREDISSFQFACPMAGNRNTASGIPVGNGVQMLPHPGFDALLQATGLQPTTAVTELALYNVGDPDIISAMVWDSGVRTGIQDALVNSMTIQYNAGEVPIVTFDMLGAIASQSDVSRALAFPTPSYGVLASIPPKLVEGVNATWAGTSRCFQTLTITIDNGVTLVQDACSADGFRRLASSPRVITVSGTNFVNDADFDAEWDAMVAAAAATDDITFQVGTSASNGNPIESHAIFLNNVRVTSHSATEIDEKGIRGISFEGVCTAPADGGEFSLQWL